MTTTMRAVQIQQTGGPEVMAVAEVPVPEPGPGQLRVEVAAAGLNFIDTYFRNGTYPAPLPLLIGKECAGVVSAVGEGVEGFSIGDRVASPLANGTYAEQCLTSAPGTFHVPDQVELEMAAAVALQGLTADYLVAGVYHLGPGNRCLIHAGAGGTGGLMIQMAKARGAEVFTTVGTPEKAAIAAEAGADHVINYSEVDFAEAVRAQLGPDVAGLDVVYDGIGADTFDRSLTLLRPRGVLALFGAASGQVPPFNLQRLNTGGSLFVTRPTLGDFIQPPEGQERADRLFGAVIDGTLTVRIGARFGLDEAGDAHRALEGRATTGKVLITP